MKTVRRQPAVATITIRGAAKMTSAQRRRIAKWMRSRAAWLEKHGDLAANLYTARWYWE